jgi:hypothetical protein
MTDWTEQSRLEMLQKLEQEERDIDVKTAQLRERKTEIQAAKGRYRFPLPGDDLCPECWFRSGLRSPMRAVVSRNQENPDFRKCPVSGIMAKLNY